MVGAAGCRFKALPAEERERCNPRHKLARQYAEEALAPLTADTDGRAKSITVETFQGEPGWLLLLITVIQADGITVPFKHFVRVI